MSTITTRAALNVGVYALVGPVLTYGSGTGSFAPGMTLGNDWPGTDGSTQFYGTPTTPGSFTWQGLGFGGVNTYIYILTVASAPTARSLSLTTGSPVSSTLSGSIFVSGTLPTGTSFSAGNLTGTPTVVGVFNFTVTDNTYNYYYTVTVGRGTIAESISLAVGVSASLTLLGAYTFSGSFPSGMSFYYGALTGTPSAGGTFTFTVTDGNYNYAYTATVAPDTLAESLSLTVGTATTATLLGSTYLSGTLPTGVTFSSGALSGTPTTAGVFTYAVTNGAHNYSYTITVAANSTTASLSWTYSSPVIAIPLTNPSLFSGTLPTGVSVSPSGFTGIYGSPTQTGTFVFVLAYGPTGFDTYCTYTLTVSVETVSIAVTVTVGVLTTFNPILGTSLASGALPTGFNLTSGYLSITAISVGVSTFSLSYGSPTLRTINYTVTAVATSTNTTLLLQVNVLTYTALSGATLVAGSLPPGLYLDSTGMNGIPTQAGIFTFTLGTGGSTPTGYINYTLKITESPTGWIAGATRTHLTASFGNQNWSTALGWLLSGSAVFRYGWTDRYIYYSGGLFWIQFFDLSTGLLGICCVVQSQYFGLSEFTATDWWKYN